MLLSTVVEHHNKKALRRHSNCHNDRK